MNKTTPFFNVLFMALAFFMATDAAAQHRSNRGNDLVDTAVEAGTFNTLAAALEAAGW